MSKPEHNKQSKKKSDWIVHRVELDEKTAHLPLAQVLIDPPKFPTLVKPDKPPATVESSTQPTESSENK